MLSIKQQLDAWSHGEDPRLTAARENVAHEALQGIVQAPRYEAGKRRRLFAHAAPLREAPSPDATQISELLFGEEFLVLDEQEGWAWGQCLHDRYVGYVPAADLLEPAQTPVTHRVISPTHLFRRADIKSAPIAALPTGAVIEAEKPTNDTDKSDQKFLKVPGVGFVLRTHVLPLDETRDYVDIATTYMHVPYLWGGRSHRGIDCSGLIQVALQCASLTLPRDSDQQAKALGAAEPAGSFQTGDLVFFPGHVGIMADSENLLHANAYHMKTVIEPLSALVERLSPQHAQPITGWVSAKSLQEIVESQA